MKQNNGGENNNSSKLESDVARDISQVKFWRKKSFELSKICFCFLDFRCKGNFELTIKTYPHGA